MEENNLELLSQNLARKIVDIRANLNITQNDLAKISDVPRSTIANLESGTGNPSLLILSKISKALNISIEMLLAPPKATCKLTKLDQLKTLYRSAGEVSILKILPESIHGMEIDKIEINIGAKMRGMPHATGTREYFHCLQGELKIMVENETYIINKGDVLAFPGETHHSYENIGKNKAIGLSVVSIVPIGS